MVGAHGRVAVLAMGLSVWLTIGGGWQAPQAAADELGDRILNLLVRKGVMTADEAASVRAEAQAGEPAATQDRLAVIAAEVDRQLQLRLADPQFAQVKDEQPAVFWADGIRLRLAPDKVFAIGGRLQYDLAVFKDRNQVKDSEDGMQFRRAQLYIAGPLHQYLEFMSHYDFAGEMDGAKAYPQDVFVRTRNLPLTLGIGQMQEPQMLEWITTNRFTTFMERSIIFDTLPCYNLGIMLSQAPFEKRMTWAAGYFKDGGPNDRNDFGDQGDADHALTGRVTGLPWYEEDGRHLLHLGVSGSWRAVERGETVQLRARPEANLAERLLDTGAIKGADEKVYEGGELALVYGPFSFQSEYMAVNVNTTSEDYGFSGWYAFVSYFLTGEHRPYVKDSGAFGRIKPKRDFVLGEGPGAWEVALRYSTADFNDGSVQGGELQDVTFGVNWYLNSVAHLMFNYILANVEDAGQTDIFQMRLSVDF